MLTSWAAGQGFSALWIAVKKPWERKSSPILISTVMFVVGDITFALSTNFPLTLISLAMIGASIPIWASSTITLLQTQSDPRMIGRVMSVFSLSLQSMMFGWFLGAWIGTIIGNAQMIIIGSLLYLVVNFGLILTSRDLRRL